MAMTTSVSVRSPLRRAAFRRLWLSRTVSFLGDGVAQTTLLLVAARQGAGAVSLVLLASALPRLLGPVAGALADSSPRRRLLVLAELGQAVAIGVLAVGTPPLWALVLVVAVAASFATVFGPASSSSVPVLVEAEELPRANALIGTALNVQVAIGPMLAGVLVSVGGPRLAFAIDVATFVGSAVLLSGLPRLEPDPGTSTDRWWTATVAGLRYVRRTPAPRALVLGLAVFVAFAGLDNVALVFLVRDDLAGSPLAFGLVAGCFGAGMLLASLTLSLWRRPTSSARMLATGTIASVGGALTTAVAPNLALAGAAQSLGGIGNGLENVALNTHVQRIVPTPMVGRVFGAVNTAAQTGSSIAYAVGGPLVAVAGPRVVFAVSGVGALLALGLYVPALRQR